MRKVKVQPLTAESFAQFGSFADLLRPERPCIGSSAVFYPDCVRTVSSGSCTGYSAVVCEYTQKMIVTEAEQHNYTTEVLLPLDGDVVCFVSPALTDRFAPELAQAFLIPQGTVIALNPGVWHKAPFPVKEGKTSTLVVLPERTYAVDCFVETLVQEKQIELML